MMAARLSWIAAGGCALAGVAAVLAVSGDAGLPTAGVWTVIAVSVGFVELRARSKRTRIFVPVMAIFSLPALTFTGGLFFLPAAAVLLLAAALTPEPHVASDAGN
jgi:uncharacterized membrane protein YvlD (DUF360 family)